MKCSVCSNDVSFFNKWNIVLVGKWPSFCRRGAKEDYFPLTARLRVFYSLDRAQCSIWSRFNDLLNDAPVQVMWRNLRSTAAFSIHTEPAAFIRLSFTPHHFLHTHTLLSIPPSVSFSSSLLARLFSPFRVFFFFFFWYLFIYLSR